MTPESFALLSALLAEIGEPAAVTTAEPGQRIVIVNELFARLAERDRAALEGQFLDELSSIRDIERRDRTLSGEPPLVLHVFRKITPTDELLAGLLATEERFRIVFSHERDAMSVLDVETRRFLDVNDAWVRQYGYSREEALEMTPADINVEQEALQDSIAACLASRDTGGHHTDLRWHKKKDGTRFPVELSCGRFPMGGHDAVYAVIRDITQRVRADEAVRRSEASFRALIESMPYAVFVHRRGQIIYINPAGLDLMGYSGHAHELYGKRAIEFVHPDEREAVERRIVEYMAQGTSAPVIEERFLRRDGSVVMVEATGIPVVYDGELASLALVRDISVKKRMEAQLITSGRLASLGRLAASVGHEINNPLAYVLGNVQMLEREIEQLAPGGAVHDETLERFRERLGVIEQGAERVRNIVRDLKTLARSDDEPRGPVDLLRVLDVCADMAAHEIRHRARLVKDYGEPVFTDASEGRLGQIFLNLLVNAAQAIPAGNVPDNEVRITTRSLGTDRVVVEISDSGVGVPEQLRGRVFEPFFTTRGSGGGMGLGLSICHHLVTSLGGNIEVSRRVPRGATFRVTLPVARRVSVQRPSPAPAPLPISGRRVLVVDDERQVAHMIRATLEGYDVTVAYSGRQAIERFERGERFDAILCDLMMGDLTGMDVYDYLSRAGSGTERRMIFMTGGTFTARAQEFLDSVDNQRLEKPFRTSAAARLIHEMLSKAEE